MIISFAIIKLILITNFLLFFYQSLIHHIFSIFIIKYKLHSRCLLMMVCMICCRITDVHSKELYQEVSEILKIRYLSDSDDIELKEVKGIIFGAFQRLIVSLPVKINQQ